MKSAYELAMERLNKKDAEAGIERKRLTDAARAEIADIRSLYRSKLAEAEILHRDALRSTADPAARQGLEEDYQRERARLMREQEARIDKVHDA